MSGLALVGDGDVEEHAPARSAETPATAFPGAASPVTASPATEAQDTVEITITELVAIEERLAHQAHLGDLHPAHARRLAAVTAELDRRWSAYA